MEVTFKSQQELAKLILNQINKDSISFNMSYWWLNNDELSKCGTSGCVAGWTAYFYSIRVTDFSNSILNNKSRKREGSYQKVIKKYFPLFKEFMFSSHITAINVLILLIDSSTEDEFKRRLINVF